MKIMHRKPVSPTIKIGFIGDFLPGEPNYKPINPTTQLKLVLS